jgi:hypothetical protein
LESSVQQKKTVAVQPVPRWYPPLAGIMKINVDAAISKNGGVAAVAAVARDDK